MMAAICASRAGMRTALLEKNARPGRKLLLTGGGRCNITNLSDLRGFIEAFGRGGNFLRHSLSVFGPDKLCAFLRRHGVALVEEGEMVFARDGAGRVFEMLENLMKDEDVELCCRHRVLSLKKSAEGWQALTSGGNLVARRRLILAPGGMTYPSTGSSGDGYEWARTMGHKIVAPVPAAGPVILKPNPFAGLQGIAVERVRATVLRNEKKRGTFEGALVVTANGVSGPAILDASVEIARIARDGKPVAVEVDFAPDAGAAELAARVRGLREESPSRQVVNSPLAPLPARLYEALIAHAGADPARRLAEVSRREMDALIGAVKRLRLEAAGTGGADECMVTVGGVATKDVDAATMRSRVAEGIYFAGEFLDLAARCGGFNLQCAFSTGYVAGSPGA